jgi:hypothetical protein
LEQIELAPLFSSTRPQIVPSFLPLRGLSNLRVLAAGGFLAEDRNARFLERMPPLAELTLGDWLTLDQYARLVVHGHNMPPITIETDARLCRSCSGTRTYLRSIAKRRKGYCSGCHADLIAAHQAEFDGLVARLRGSRSKSSKP